MCVQYIGGDVQYIGGLARVHWGDIMRTSECSVHWGDTMSTLGMFSTLGDTMSRLGKHIMSTSGRYHE